MLGITFAALRWHRLATKSYKGRGGQGDSDLLVWPLYLLAVVGRSSFIPRETGQEAVRKATSLDDDSYLEKQQLSFWEGLICPGLQPS